MMMLKVYSIFDSAAGVYQRPFFCLADGEASRAFEDLAGDSEHPVGKHPGDYRLFRIGTYEDVDGVIVGSAPVSIVGAHELVSDKLEVVS